MPNNIDFLVQVVQHPGFSKSQATTSFFEQNMTQILDSLLPPKLNSMTQHTKFGLASLMFSSSQPVGSGVWSGDKKGLNNWRGSDRAVKKSFELSDNSDSCSVEVSQIGSDQFSITSGGEIFNCVGISFKKVRDDVSTNSFPSSVWFNKIEMDGRLVSGTVSIHKNSHHSLVIDTWIDGQTGTAPTHVQFTVPAPEKHFGSQASDSLNPTVLSPMPGKVIKLCVTDGQVVEKGDPLVILEAMKMEHVVYAPCNG